MGGDQHPSTTAHVGGSGDANVTAHVGGLVVRHAGGVLYGAAPRLGSAGGEVGGPGAAVTRGPDAGAGEMGLVSPAGSDAP